MPRKELRVTKYIGETDQYVVVFTRDELKELRGIVADNFPRGPVSFPFPDPDDLLGHHFVLSVDGDAYIEGTIVRREDD